MKRTLLALLAAWLLGIAMALAGVVVTGGWYEYRFVGVTNASSPLAREWLKTELEAVGNSAGWQPVPNVTTRDGTFWYRRPRIRLGW